jgi:hypothetical protein
MKQLIIFVLVFAMISISCILPTSMPISLTATFIPSNVPSSPPTATLVPATEVPTETPTPQPTEIVITFPENLRNQGDGITFQMSESAKHMADIQWGTPIESISVDPAALTQMRADFIKYIEAIYTDFDHVYLSGKIWFIEPSASEVKWNGSQFVVNTDASKYWDTSKPLNLFAVTTSELEKIKEELGNNDPSAPRYNYTLRPESAGGSGLVYTDDTGATNAYASVEFFLMAENIAAYAKRCPLCVTLSPNSRITMAIVYPLTYLEAENIAIRIGRRVGFNVTYNWAYDDLGCSAPDDNNYIDNCSAVTIK